jgi:hypothetical protein
MPATTFQAIRLRYEGTCCLCGTALPVGTQAGWNPRTKQVRCAACGGGGAAGPGSPHDPFVVERPDRGTAGRSAESLFGWRGDKGAAGERKLGALLDQRADLAYVAIHDRRIPGHRTNIDHLAVSARGVFVIDAKRWEGKIEWASTDLRARVLVGGRDRTDRLAGALGKQARGVREVLDTAGHGEVPVAKVVCFVDGDWPVLQPSFRAEGMLVTRPRALIRRLGKGGPLTYGVRRAVAHALIEALPPA